MITVLAEKPSVGRDLARVMGGTKKEDGYMEGNGYLFTWCFGHLVQLAMPEHYGFKWGDALPFFPSTFDVVPCQKRSGKDYHNDPGVMKQIKVVQECFKRSSEIIVATDAGREGELIFRYLYQYLTCTLPFKRLWISSMTDSAIQEGFKSIKEGKAYDKLYYAAKARSEADWLVGLNATQALSKIGKSLYSLGRVQTPTLMLICARYWEHKNFVKEKFYKYVATVSKGSSFEVESINQWDTREEAPVLNSKTGRVVEVETKVETKKAPRLHDLTSLQKEANKCLGMSADKTLAVVQSLYEKKMVTYPRTGSQYLTQDVFDQLPIYIKSIPESLHIKLPAILNKAVVNDAKVTDHHALLCTENPFSGSEEEKSIYDLVVVRMVEALSDDAKGDRTKIKINIGGEPFSVSAIDYFQPGWRAVQSLKKGKEEEQEDKELLLPPLKVGDEVSVDKMVLVERETKPKALFTEASLLEAMETAGKSVTDEQEKEAMKDRGLGTPATRASILEILLDRTYIVREKKKLIPTQKGLTVYEIMKEKSLGKADLTGNWEKRLNDMQAGRELYDTFLRDIKAYTKEVTTDILSMNGSELRISADKLEKEVCPRCGKPLKFVKNDKMDALLCSDQARECRFILWRTVAKKKLADKDLLALAGEKAKTGLIRGFSGKNGKFDAFLKRTGEKVEFVFNHD